MKKIINYLSQILSIIFILSVSCGAIFCGDEKKPEEPFIPTDEEEVEDPIEMPTLTQILQKYKIPVLEIDGDTADISKDNKVNVEVKYHSDELNFNSNATIKWQGSSSLVFDKKNYNISLVDEHGEKNKIKIKDEWGKQSKYCLKANYIDHTSSRNVVSAKLFGEVVHSRNMADELDALVNGGAIDGFPIVLFMNNEYQGIYTLNTPKDKWIFDMDKTGHKAILMADQWSDSTRLKATINSDVISSGWEVEYCSTEESTEGTAWAIESFNNLIEFVNENDGEDFKNNIGNYTDINRNIDLMLYTLMINGQDNLSKNILWVTYDGTTWIPSAYDLDSTWGLYFNGSLMSENEWLKLDSFRTMNNTNLLWKKILSNFKQEVKDRYFELRSNVLSFKNISYQFTNFVSEIPTQLYEYETSLYPNIPSQKLGNVSQILYFAKTNLEKLDVEFTNF